MKKIIRRSGIGLGTALTIIFGIFKLMVIQPFAIWSWWLIVLPMFIPLLIQIFVWTVLLVAGLTVALVGGIAGKIKLWRELRKK